MRRITAFNNISADGYFSTTDGQLDWVVPDVELDKEAAQASQSGGSGTFLFGRRTYDMFASFWPHALSEKPTSPDPHHPTRVSKEMHAIAVALTEATKLVFSRSLKDATWKNSRIVRELDLRAIEAMKRESGPDIMIFGSGSVVSELSKNHLIDEYIFVVSPVLLGAGRSLLTGLKTKLPVRLEEAKTFPSGNVRLRYTLSV